jgi:ferredoxin
MGLVSAGDPRHAKRKKTKVGQDVCLGCGVCVRTCDRNALALRARGKRVLTPVTTAHRTVLMAIERGKLQNLIFDIQLVGAFDGQPLSLVVGRDFKPPTIAPASFHFIRLEIRT